MVLRAVLLLSLVFCCISSQAKELAVVVDKSNTVAEITSADLAKILILDTTTWKSGQAVRVVVRDSSTMDLEDALQRLLNMPSERVKSLIAAHKTSFLVAKSDDELVNLVASHPGAIGLVNVYAINSKISVVKIDSKLPLEHGYPLR